MLGSVRMTKVQSDKHQSMRGDELRKALTRDIEKGYIPFLVRLNLGSIANFDPNFKNISISRTLKNCSIAFSCHLIFLTFQVVATLGTTNSLGFDNIAELGQVCKSLSILDKLHCIFRCQFY